MARMTYIKALLIGQGVQLVVKTTEFPLVYVLVVEHELIHYALIGTWTITKVIKCSII